MSSEARRVHPRPHTIACASADAGQKQQAALDVGILQQAIFNSASFSSIATDTKGVIQVFTVGAERMLGYTSADVVHRMTPADMADPRDLFLRAEAMSLEYSTPVAPNFEALAFKALRSAEDIYDLTFIRKDGSRFPTMVSVTALRDAQAAVIGYLLIATEGTTREQARVQGAALNAAANAIAITNRSGLIEWVNPAFSELTGYTATEAVGRNPRDLVKSDHHDPAFYEDLWETILSGQVWRGEMVNRRKDNSLYTEEQTITPVRDVQGEISHFIAIKQDISTRKRDEEAFRRSAEVLRISDERTGFALHNANVGIWDLDYRTGVLKGSDIFESHLGLRPGTSVGTVEGLLECIHPLDRDAMRQTIAVATRSGVDFRAQYRTLRPDGTIRWLAGRGRVHLGAHGEPVRAVGISLDVTDRHTLEEHLQQAQKMDAVGRLAGGVAHDFNNLLTAILGYCELLLADIHQGDPRAADIVEIEKAGTRAAGLTRQLLAFSRKQAVETTLLDLNAIVTDIRAMLGRVIGENVTIEVHLLAGPALVKADRGQIEQVVVNLAVNARDAMPSGGTLTITTANVELDEHYVATHPDVRPGPYVVLSVTDTGTGMTPAVRARLFEPFFTTKEAGKGTGLGLATVYGIVTRSGGSVGVHSELGKGTTFTVHLPRVDAEPETEETAAPTARSRAGQLTVLLVEDEEGLRVLAGRLLQRLGHTVLIAADAAEACRVFDEHAAIDLLLTDVVMPGASGSELTRKLIEQRPALKVIYMSGYTEDAIVQHGVFKAGVAFLSKPFTSRTLEQKIREVFER